jgi:DNA topoisomerase-1
MSIAQGLYENGHITYMRTDSVSLSAQAITAARAAAQALYGAGSVPSEPRLYKGKSKNSQEAHEAVRPAGDTFASPSELASVLRSDELKLYDLIWKRTVASQMVDAKGETVSITIEAQPLPSMEGVSFQKATLSASGTILSERGFLQAYQESKDDETAEPEKEAEAMLCAVERLLSPSGSHSLSRASSRSASPTSWTTTSPLNWKKTSTALRVVKPSAASGCTSSTLAMASTEASKRWRLRQQMK